MKKLVVYCLSLLVPTGVFAAARTVEADTAVRYERIDSSVVRAYSFYENSISAFGSPLKGLSKQSLPQNVTLEQALRLMPSVDIRERGGKSVQSDISIRGGSADQTGLLLNGIDFTDIRTGHQTHSLPVDADIVGEMRLLDGGNQGLTGAINMIAGPSEPEYLRVHLAGGDHLYRYANVSGATRREGKGTLDLFGAASLKGSAGYRPSTDFNNYNLYSLVRYSSAAVGSFEAQAGYQNRAFGANGFYSLNFPDQFEQTSTAIASLRWNKTISRLLLESYVSYRRNTDRFELIRGSETKVPFNYHLTDNYGFYLSASYVWLAGRTSLSGELRHSKILSTVLGETLSEPLAIQGASDRFYTKGGTRRWGNVQLRHQKQWEHFGVKASFEADFSPYGITPLWNAGLDWKPDENWSLRLVGARTMRLPTFTDLYYTATGYVGNPNLVPEKATMVVADLLWTNKVWSLSADAIFCHGSNLIDWVKEDAASPWESRQITSMNTAGVDFNVGFTPENGVVESLNLRGGYVWADKDSGSLISKYVMDYMRFKTSFVAAFRFGRHFRLSADATLYDRYGKYTDALGQTQSYEPYVLVNASLSYKVGAFKFYIDLENATSTAYFDYGGLPMPGIWAMGGVVITLR